MGFVRAFFFWFDKLLLALLLFVEFWERMISPLKHSSSDNCEVILCVKTIHQKRYFRSLC